MKRIRIDAVIQSWIARRWSLLLAVMAFLLGRAMILDELAPFALAYFAVIYFLRRDLTPWIGCFLFIGSMFAVQPHSAAILTELLIYYLFQKVLEHYGRSELSYAPLVVLMSTFIVRLLSDLAGAELNGFALMMTAVESVFSFVLTLVFIQAVPVLTVARKNNSLKHEEVICLIILLASVMTGTVGWSFGGVSPEHILSRYLILIFAFVGGAPMGASVGVIAGLILSLADVRAIVQMSTLAFAGLLAGLLKEGNKLAVGLGMLIGASILSVYVGTRQEAVFSAWESMISVALFLLTPGRFIQSIAKYVPGTRENVKFQYEYARKIRDITAGRVQQFSEVFRQLSSSFTQFDQEGASGKKERAIGHFMDQIAEQACAHCWKREQCWNDKFYLTYKYMTEMVTAVESNPDFRKEDMPPEWKKVCVKTDRVLELMKRQYEQYKNDLHWKKQISESRHLVADQLSGVSRVMDDLAREIKREGQELFLQEEQIRSALEQLGLSIHSIDVINLDHGHVEIEVMHQYSKGLGECRKIIAPLLSDILNENIVVKSESAASQGGGMYIVLFGSAREYEVETGMAGAAKGGDLLSGDSFSTAELGGGKFALAISDGMGNGERAQAESSAALSILQQLLQSGMDEQLAIKSVNSVLLLRSSDEMFATIDVAIIDLNTAQTTFLKIGSAPSFIKRRNEVIQVSANNLPLGIVSDIEVDLVSVPLQPEDTLIMMTDGIYDAPGPAINKDLWMKRIILEIEAEAPQDIADCLLETIVRYHHGEIHDDMTILVARLDKYKPEWKTVRWQGLPRIERPKTVS